MVGRRGFRDADSATGSPGTRYTASFGVAHMLQTKMSPSSAVLRPYVWAYGMTTGRVQSAPLLVPLPARPKQLLTFSFADRYRSLRPGSGQHDDASPRVTVVGPQTHARPGLSVFGQIDNFTIHFQPS